LKYSELFKPKNAKKLVRMEKNNMQELLNFFAKKHQEKKRTVSFGRVLHHIATVLIVKEVYLLFLNPNQCINSAFLSACASGLQQCHQRLQSSLGKWC